VDHTHADAIVTLTNTPHREDHVRAALGEDVVIVPYVMPGFKLARLCAELFPAGLGPSTIGMVLLNHGLFTFGETARESYERTIELVDRAERYLQQRAAWTLDRRSTSAPEPVAREIAALRADVSRALGSPAILSVHRDARISSFLERHDLGRVSRQGPATPDHVIRTKRIPMLGRDVGAYASAYRQYFEENRARAESEVSMLDPAPRVVLDPCLGMVTIGSTVKDADIAADIYRHTIDIIERAEALDAYSALPEGDIFDVEYWDLEQAKLRSRRAPAPLSGEVALVTGGASGIGHACVAALEAAGAAVVVLDINPAIAGSFSSQTVLAIECDVADSATVRDAIDQGVRRFGGLDILVLNAGVFPGGTRIESLGDDEWDRVMRVNVDANMRLMRLGHPFLALAPRGGRVVVIGSKNVPAPGPGAAAYSASKAALTQLARVAALEWGRDGIRVNVLHPNAVFDTGLWSDTVLAERARHHGVTVEEYRRSNVLGVEVSSADVAALAVALCGPAFAKTTGAQIPIDGGNERVI
jgi:NAD(P)-dependent dehydrogenase (short-subunit alcohol dehydrogenase family)